MRRENEAEVVNALRAAVKGAGTQKLLAEEIGISLVRLNGQATGRVPMSEKVAGYLGYKLVHTWERLK